MAKIAVTGTYPDTHVDDNDIPGLNQLVKDTVTGAEYVGDGVTPLSALTALPGGGGVDLAVLRSSSGSGYQLEYNGSAIALGSGNVQPPFDTAYITTDGSTNVPFTALVENDQIRFTPFAASASVTFLASGLWLAKLLVDFDGVTTKPVRAVSNMFSEWVPAGQDEVSIKEVIVADATVDAHSIFTLKVDAADAALNVTYAWLSLTPLSLEG